MKLGHFLAVVCTAFMLASCNNATPKKAEKPVDTPPMVGSDKDAHGCIGSAGYTWSALRNECIRLFESGIRLDPQAAIADKTVSTFVVFKSPSEDVKAEVYLPGEGAPRMYVKQANNKAGDTGTWKEGSMTLRLSKGIYILEDPQGRPLYQSSLDK